MSARKIQSGSPFGDQFTVAAPQTQLSLPRESVVIHKNGIEFHSPAHWPVWTEMTVTLESSLGEGRVNCSGVVIGCTGNKHAGYEVSLVFTGLSKQAEARLSSLAVAPLR